MYPAKREDCTPQQAKSLPAAVRPFYANFVSDSLKNGKYPDKEDVMVAICVKESMI